MTKDVPAVAAELAEDVAAVCDELKETKETVVKLEAKIAADEVEIREAADDEAFIEYLLNGGDALTYDHSQKSI